MANGLSGFVNGVIQGMPVGQQLGDAIAVRRSANRMSDIQDQLDAGAFDPANFGGDSAAAQQALQSAVRNAQQPSSQRGVGPNDYGDSQYSRLLREQQLRGDQQGGAMMNGGDLAGGLMKSSQTAASLGNLPGAMQASQTSGQVAAGNAAIDNSGPGGTPQVNQQSLAQGVATNNARSGDAAGAASWGGQEYQQRDAALQGMLGRALTVGMNPQLGGLQAAAPYLHSAAQLSGYGDAQWSPSENAVIVLDKSGKAVAKIDQQSLPQFAQTIGNDPSKILSAVRGQQANTAQTQLDTNKADRGAYRDYMFSNAGKFSDAGLNVAQATRQAETLTQKAEMAGWKIDTGTGQPATDATGAQVGQKWFAQPPGGGAPVVITMLTPDPNNPANPSFSVTDANGRPLDPSQLGAQGGAVQAAIQAQQAQAMKANAELNQNRYQQMQARGQDIYSQLQGRSSMAPTGAMGSGGSTPVPAALSNYQSQNPHLDAAQLQQESGGRQGATSPKGAQGAMQLMPATRQELEKEFGLPDGASLQNDPQGQLLNTKLGQVYRDRLISAYSNQLGDPQKGQVLGLMAYDWGMGHVNNWLQAGAPAHAVPSETRKYVNSILGASQGRQQPASSGMMPSQAPRALPRVIPNGPANKYLYKG